jgi:cyanate permease
MAQEIGYALAAKGPTLVGKLHAQTDSWSVPILLIASLHLRARFSRHWQHKTKK